jgi:hypothetical protein
MGDNGIGGSPPRSGGGGGGACASAAAGAARDEAGQTEPGRARAIGIVGLRDLIKRLDIDLIVELACAVGAARRGVV